MSWQCPACGENIDNEFDVCWACGTTSEGVKDPTFSQHVEEEEQRGGNADDDTRAPTFTVRGLFILVTLAALVCASLNTWDWRIKEYLRAVAAFGKGGMVLLLPGLVFWWVSRVVRSEPMRAACSGIAVIAFLAWTILAVRVLFPPLAEFFGAPSQ